MRCCLTYVLCCLLLATVVQTTRDVHGDSDLLPGTHVYLQTILHTASERPPECLQGGWELTTNLLTSTSSKIGHNTWKF
jgi:hypothetical protein